MRLRLFTVFAGIVLAGCVGPFSEMVEREYASLEVARAADAVGEYRWIPGILPQDATSIREVHNFDTNRTWGCFKTQSPASVRALLAGLKAKEASGDLGSGPSELLRDFSWWPESMHSGSVEAWEFREPAAYPTSPRPVVRVGLDPLGQRVCFRRTR